MFEISPWMLLALLALVVIILGGYIERKGFLLPGRKPSFQQLLFAGALLIYLAVRWIGLESFPIYFFSDEAVNANLASDFLRDGFRSYESEFFPTFFKNNPYYNLSTSVYIQLLPVAIFGKHVWLVRAVPALLSLLAALAVAGILHYSFKRPYAWSAVLILSAVPAWFLHSRTAFEAALMVTFYALFLFAYLRYREGHTRLLSLALLAAALSFYTYSPARLVIGLHALVFGLLDLKFHWQHRRAWLKALPLIALLVIPYLRFQLNHPTAAADQLHMLGSYWMSDIGIGQKLVIFFSEYLKAFDPRYWFLPGDHTLIRHVLKGYGHLWWGSLPFFLFGLIRLSKERQNPAVLRLLVSALLLPAGAALLEVGITRLLTLIIPASIITTLGFIELLSWLERLGIPRARLAVASFTLLGVFNAYLLTDSLYNAPTWYSDYGMSGMQFGARQVFAEINTLQAQNPGTPVVLSPEWANGADVLARFFSPIDPPQVELSSLHKYLFNKVDFSPNTIFVLDPPQYHLAVSEPKFSRVDLIKILSYPNGEPGFYFVRLAYSPEIDQILAAEQAERRQPIEEQIALFGQQVQARYSRLDIGQIQNAFDGDLTSLCRTQEANPAVIELSFPEPIPVKRLAFVVGSSQVEITLTIQRANGEPYSTQITINGTFENPSGELLLSDTIEAAAIRFEIRDINQSEPGNVHIWEIGIEAD